MPTPWPSASCSWPPRRRPRLVPEGDLDKALQSESGQAGGEQPFLEEIKKADISIDHVKTSIGETLLINAYLKGIVEGGAKVAEADVRKAYDEAAQTDQTASVRHILFMTQGKTDAEKAEIRTKAEGVLAKAQAGEDFAELAKQYSEDPGSKDNGGLYENFPRGQMVKPFEDASFTLPVGGLSGLVETSFGYHIIKVVERKKESRTFEEARAEIESRLQQAKQGTLVQDTVQALKDKAKVELIKL